jgi:hypothetical protein
MNKAKLCNVLAVFLFLVCAFGSAHAAVVTQTFTGSITSISGTLFGLSPSIGDQVQGTITYDTSQPPAFDTGEVAGYIQVPPSGMSVVISGVTLQSQNYNSFQVINNAFGPVDNINGFFTPISVDGVLQSGFSSINFSLTDFTLSALSSTALPPSLNIANFSQRSGSAFDAESGGFLSFAIDVPDADEDGVPDNVDSCPTSNVSPIVVVDACNTGVANTLFPSGCTISDHIAECADGVRNHGAFVSCISHLNNDLKAAGVISDRQQGAIQSCAAHARIP